MLNLKCKVTRTGRWKIHHPEYLHIIGFGRTKQQAMFDWISMMKKAHPDGLVNIKIFPLLGE